MNHFWKSKIQHFLFIFICCFLCACGSKADAETNGNTTEDMKSTTITPSVSAESTAPQVSSTPESTPTPVIPQTPRYHATIYDNLGKGTKIELDIAEGDTVNLSQFVNLLGYDFNGCYKSQQLGSEQYINQDGLVCTEVVSDITLYAWYEPRLYTLSFTCDSKAASLYGIQNINVAYDTDLRELLPLNRIIDENKLIYSVFYNDRFLTDITESGKLLLNEALLQNSEVFTDNSKIVLNLKTVTTSIDKYFGIQEVCIKDDYDQFEQRFKDEYICDSLSFEDIDFELLEQLGFNTAVINITCCIREKDDGKQEIYVYHTAYENNPDDSTKEKKQKKKAMEDFLLEKKIYDCEEKEKEETTTLIIDDVSLARLKTGTGIYVYYGASGFSDDDWYRVYTDINVHFEQRLNK